VARVSKRLHLFGRRLKFGAHFSEKMFYLFGGGQLIVSEWWGQNRVYFAALKTTPLSF
jgi:hypothetical protein